MRKQTPYCATMGAQETTSDLRLKFRKDLLVTRYEQMGHVPKPCQSYIKELDNDHYLHGIIVLKLYPGNVTQTYRDYRSQTQEIKVRNKEYCLPC